MSSVRPKMTMATIKIVIANPIAIPSEAPNIINGKLINSIIMFIMGIFQPVVTKSPPQVVTEATHISFPIWLNKQTL